VAFLHASQCLWELVATSTSNLISHHQEGLLTCEQHSDIAAHNFGCCGYGFKPSEACLTTLCDQLRAVGGITCNQLGLFGDLFGYGSDQFILFDLDA
jgi:hypothetical protein